MTDENSAGYQTPFAAFIAIGPGPVERERSVDLLESLAFYEPLVAHVIIVEDGSHGKSIVAGLDLPRTCNVTILPHPRPLNKLNTWGGLCAADLVAVRHVHKLKDVRFALKLDTDSLVIAPFLQRIGAFLQCNPESGMIGVLGTSCNRSTCSFEVHPRMASSALKSVRLGLESRTLSEDERRFLSAGGITTVEQHVRFSRLCRLLAPILNKNFSGAYCQGGGYAISAQMISRLASHGFLEDPSLWLDLRIGEDQMMGMLCAITDLQATDFCDRNQVFGIQWRGLPYSPRELRDYGYGIVHSVKNDSRYSESDIRRYFRGLRCKQESESSEVAEIVLEP